MPRLYSALASGWVVGISGLVNLAVMLALKSADADMRPAWTPGVVDLQFSFSLAAFSEILVQWGPAGIEGFRRLLWIDCVFPVAYAFFLSSSIAWLSKGPSAPGKGILFVFAAPWASAFFDYVENALHLGLIEDVGNLSEGKIIAASMAASVKWILALVSIAAVFYLAWGAIRVKRAGR